MASDESSFITGSDFIVDGGLTSAYVTAEWNNFLSLFINLFYKNGRILFILFFNDYEKFDICSKL